jgi:hypothetical protein
VKNNLQRSISVQKQVRQQTRVAECLSKGIRTQYRNVLRHNTGIHKFCTTSSCRVADRANQHRIRQEVNKLTPAEVERELLRLRVAQSIVKRRPR